MKDFWAFLVQFALLWPVSFLACAWMLRQPAEPHVITWEPVVALAFGAAAGGAVTAVWPGLRWSAQVLCLIPVWFLLLDLGIHRRLSPDYYLVSGSNEGGLGVALVTLPAAFYIGYSAAAFLRGRNRRPRSGVPEA